MRTIKDILAETLKNLKPEEVASWEVKIRPGREKKRQKKIKLKEKSRWRIIKRKKSENSDKLSEWERLVQKKLNKSKIKFSKKFRKFPLEINDNVTYFTPDFRLDFPYKKRQHVLVEVHEELEESDVKKFRTFMDVYGRIYWLIIVTKYGELRKWNKFDNAEQSLFHDIWTLDDINDLISKLERLRTESKQNLKNEIVECKKCEKSAEGMFEIQSLFGYKSDGKTPRSFCNVCRNKKLKDSNILYDEIGRPKNVFCPGCGLEFLEKIRGQSFCEKCLKEYFN